MLPRPRLQLDPIPTLSVLPHAGNPVHFLLHGARGVICVTKDLSPQRVETVGDVVPLPALRFAVAVFGHGNVDDFLIIVRLVRLAKEWV